MDSSSLHHPEAVLAARGACGAPLSVSSSHLPTTGEKAAAGLTPSQAFRSPMAHLLIQNIKQPIVIFVLVFVFVVDLSMEPQAALLPETGTLHNFCWNISLWYRSVD